MIHSVSVFFLLIADGKREYKFNNAILLWNDHALFMKMKLQLMKLTFLNKGVCVCVCVCVFIHNYEMCHFIFIVSVCNKSSCSIHKSWVLFTLTWLWKLGERSVLNSYFLIRSNESNNNISTKWFFINAE